MSIVYVLARKEKNNIEKKGGCPHYQPVIDDVFDNNVNASNPASWGIINMITKGKFDLTTPPFTPD